MDGVGIANRPHGIGVDTLDGADGGIRIHVLSRDEVACQRGAGSIAAVVAMNHGGAARLPVRIDEGENSWHDREEAEVIVEGVEQQHRLVRGEMIDARLAQFLDADGAIKRDDTANPLIDQRVGVPRGIRGSGSACQNARESPVDQIVSEGSLLAGWRALE